MNVVTSTPDMTATTFLLRDGGSAAASSDALFGHLFKHSKEHLRLKLYAALAAVDFLCIVFGFVTAAALWLGPDLGAHTFRNLTIVTPTFFAIALNNRAYSIEVLKRPSLGALKAVEALLYACGLAIAMLFYLKVSTDYSRLIVAAGTLLSLMSLVIGRVFAGKFIGNKYRWTFVNRLLILDGLAVRPRRGEVPVLADQLGIDIDNDDPVAFNRLSHLLERCDSVVVASLPEHRMSWSQALKGMRVEVEILAPELTELGAIAVRESDGRRSLLVRGHPLNFRDQLVKRTLDISVALAAIVLLAPLMLIVALGIRLESPGPILFRQQRVGLGNRWFELLKFRSMRVDAEDAAASRLVSRTDDRVTPFGRFIRRTSLDELPQLFNVLRGEMSIVGPRPHALGATAGEVLYWEIDKRYFYRHAVKPGITGLAQVRGFRGSTMKREDLTDRLAADLEYVTDWTVWRDLKIIITTFGVLGHANAF